MKKKIVYFLCELGLLKIANKISPSLVVSWRRKKMHKVLQRHLKMQLLRCLMLLIL